MIERYITLDRNPHSHEAHMQNASAYLLQAMRLEWNGYATGTPDRPFKLPMEGKTWTPQKPAHEKAPRHRSKHENIELSHNEEIFNRLLQRGYTPEQAAERVGYANARSALNRVRWKLARQRARDEGK
jgi:hypothetical protein